MARTFVSYASPDRDLAFRIAAFLESEGIPCWIAPRDVPPGVEYGAAIIEGIEASVAMVLVLSEHSNDSQFVRKEVERAVSKAKPVLPVRIREVTPSGSLEFFISSAQWVDAWRSPMEQHLSQLAQAVRAIAGQPGPVRAPAAAAKRRSRVPIIAAGVALALAAAASGVYAWAPWLPAWQRGGTGFLAGSWCQPMSGDAIMRLDLRKSGAETVNGEFHYSHASRVDRFRARASLIADGFEFTWLEPPEMIPLGPSRYRVLDDASMRLVFAEGEEQDLPPLTRCAPGTGGN